MKLYIFWFLHQTTTLFLFFCFCVCCISFDSYIKPQLCCFFVFCLLVVYLLIPTSNHNRSKPKSEIKKLYIFWFLHQTTTFLVIMKCLAGCISFDSYIKPQPNRLRRRSSNGCISFDSYIKPQHYRVPFVAIPVVYLLIPTSNHNWQQLDFVVGYVVYLLIPTSNHNL